MKAIKGVRRSAIVALSALLLAYLPTAHAATLTITTPSTQTAVVGSAFSLQISAAGGTGGNQFAVATGTLPSGLALNPSTGEISGNPTASQSNAITVRVTDNSSATATTSSFTINTGWIVSTYAGSGAASTSGDGGQATSAGMTPHSISITSDGTLYISDVSNSTLRKITTSGVISTVSAPISIITGMHARDNGDIYFTKWNYTVPIQKFQASNASVSVWSDSLINMNQGRGMTVDLAGNLLIAEAAGQYIRRFAADGSVTNIAGTGSSGFSGDGGAATSAAINSPFDVAVDPSGNVYFTDVGNYRIRKISTNGVISTILGNGQAINSGDGGLAVNAKASNLWGIAVDGAGNIFFGERGGGCIRRIDATTGIVTRVAGTGTAGANDSPVNGISSTAVFSTIIEQMRFDRNGNLYLTDYWNHMVRKIAGIGVPFNTVTSASVTLSAAGSFAKGVTSTLSTEVNATGKVTFYSNGKKIPGCIGLSASGSTPITVTCNWKPMTSGAFALKAVLTPTSDPSSPVASTAQVKVGRRTNNR